MGQSERFEPFEESNVAVLLEGLEHNAEHGDHVTRTVLSPRTGRDGGLTHEGWRARVLALLRANNDEDQYPDQDLLCAAWRWVESNRPNRCDQCWVALPDQSLRPVQRVCDGCAVVAAKLEGIERCPVCDLPTHVTESAADGTCVACLAERFMSFRDWKRTARRVAWAERAGDPMATSVGWSYENDGQPPVALWLYEGDGYVAEYARQSDGPFHAIIGTEEHQGEREDVERAVYEFCVQVGVLPKRGEAL